MGTVTVLAGSTIDLRKLERQLARARYTTVRTAGGLRVSGDGEQSAVDASLTVGKQLTCEITKGVSELIGTRPTAGVTCVFEGAFTESAGRSTVVGIARALAAIAPLAVLRDDGGTLYLVNPKEGLISAADCEPARSTTPTSALLRRLFGDR